MVTAAPDRDHPLDEAGIRRTVTGAGEVHHEPLPGTHLNLTDMIQEKEKEKGNETGGGGTKVPEEASLAPYHEK